MEDLGNSAPVSHPPVPVSEWGKDHWSTLAYIETVCVDSVTTKGIGSIVFDRMRVDRHRHPMLIGRRQAVSFSGVRDNEKNYPTRLRNDRELHDHDDWDCLDDMEKAGLVEVISQANGRVRMTDAGLAMAAKLRAHKARGGKYADFDPAK